MTRLQFEAYRSAFEALIDCSASPRPAKACAAEWASGVVGPPLGSGPREPARARGMTLYYVNDVLRAHGQKSAYCAVA